MNIQNIRAQAAYQDSFFISFFICILIIVVFLQTSEQFFHWFLIPVTLGGILIGIDAVDWFLGRLNIFDPVGILGLYGFHFFFLAPLLHVSWNMWLDPWSPTLPEWRPWIGGMAILNLLGIILYRFFYKLAAKNVSHQSVKTLWYLDRKRLPMILGFFLMLSGALQIMVYQQSGGVVSYITTNNVYAGGVPDEGKGQGILFIVSESFPILAMIGFAAYAQKHKRMRNWNVLLLVLLVYLVITIFFGGLRGSRANTIWALFWAAGIIHFWIRSLTKKHIAIGVVFLFLFMYFYGFFKSGGIEGIQKAFEGQEARAQLEKDSGRTWQATLLGDLGRSDVQALLLHKITHPNSDYKYAWGRTYFAAMTILIPSVVMPDKPPNKSKEGTDAAFGKGSFIPVDFVYSKIYGLAGEAMLNFGPMAVPFAFIPLGLFVGRIQRLFYMWEASDTRSLLLPMLVNFCFVILVSDLDNDIFFLVKSGSLPLIVIVLISRKKSLATL